MAHNTLDRLTRNENTFMSLDQTSVDRRFQSPYLKTYGFPGDHIDNHHQELAQKIHPSGMIDHGIEGWLLPADAKKLYEMAYFCTGNILELGTYRGLSSSIMSKACFAANKQNEIISVDLDQHSLDMAADNLKSCEGGRRVHLFRVEGTQAIKDQAAVKAKFGFAFVDHSHEYDHVYNVSRCIHRVIPLGGFVLFHDFNDPRNAAADAVDYGVYQGVMDGLDPRHWQFWGIFGCTGLFRRVGLW